MAIKQPLEICLADQPVKVIIRIFFKGVPTKWAPAKMNLLTLIIQGQGGGRWLFCQTHRANVHIRDFFDKWLRVFQKNILAALTTKEILDALKGQLLRLLIRNTKPYQ